MARIARVNAGTLNVRAKPNGLVVAQLPRGAVVSILEGVTARAANLDWQGVLVDTLLGWVAVKYLDFGSGGGGAPPPPTQGIKIGVHSHHFLGEPLRGSFLGMVERLAKAGRPLHSVTITNDAGVAADVKRLSPSTVLIWRPNVTEKNTPPQLKPDLVANEAAGRAWLVGLLGSLTPLKDIFNYAQLANEWYSPAPLGDAAFYGAFYIGAMKEADDRGFKITVGDFSMGAPEPKDMPGLDAMFRYAEAHGHALNVHLYSPLSPEGNTSMRASLPWFVGRPLLLKIPETYPKLVVVAGEVGTGNPTFWGIDETLALMNEAQEVYKDVSQVIGLNWWSIIGNDAFWQFSNMASALPQLETWLLS